LITAEITKQVNEQSQVLKNDFKVSIEEIDKNFHLRKEDLEKERIKEVEM